MNREETGQERRAAFQRFVPAEEPVHRLLLMWSDFTASNDSLQPGGRRALTSCTHISKSGVSYWCKSTTSDYVSAPPIAEATENEDQFKQSSTGGVGQMDELDFSIWKLSNPTAGKIINLQPEMWQKET